MSRTIRRSRALASLTVVAGLTAATLATTLVIAPARSAAPTGDCAVAFPVGELAAGDAVHGLTVTHGTQPEGFTGEVLGVLEDGIAPDVDMVMVRLTSPEIDRVGVWQGMSGSPVYAEDGRLIGAVGYGLAMGRSTVAGVTPFDAMDDYLADAPAAVAVDRAAAREVARGSDVPVARAQRGFEQHPMPLGVAGVGAASLARAAGKAGERSWLPQSAYAVGRAGEVDTTAADIVAGGNLAASLAYGDVTMAGIGTATSVCGDRVVGFGHPLEWAGRTSLALHPADAIYIQDDLISGFKVANLGTPVGTITDDRGAGITGTLGTLPATTDVTSALTHGDRARVGVSHVTEDSADALASTAFFGLVANHQAVVDGRVKGTEDLTLTITGADAAGDPFTLDYDNLYASSGDLIWRLGFTMGDLVYSLARMPGVTIDSITIDGDLTDRARTYRITRMEARQHGDWVEVDRRTGLIARAGTTLATRVTITGGGRTVVLPSRLELPKRLAGRVQFLQAVGGAQAGTGRMPRQVDQVADWLDQQVRNDQLVVSLSRRPRYHGGGSSIMILARKRAQQRDVRDVLGPLHGVVRGNVVVPVLVK